MLNGIQVFDPIQVLLTQQTSRIDLDYKQL